MSEAVEDQSIDAIIELQEGYPGTGVMEGITTGSAEDQTCAAAGVPAQDQKMESPTCPKCRRGNETVEHYLTVCKAFVAQRGCMERHLRRAAKSISTLLNNPKVFPNLFRFIQDTRRFQGTTRDI